MITLIIFCFVLTWSGFDAHTLTDNSKAIIAAICTASDINIMLTCWRTERSDKK